MTRGRILAVLLALTCIYAVARVPHATWSKRLAQLEEQERLGEIGYNIGRTWPEHAELVRWIRANTPEDAIVLWRGKWKGVLELIAAAIGERLLYEEALWPSAELRATTRFAKRQLARGERDGVRGVLVLEADGERVALRARP